MKSKFLCLISCVFSLIIISHDLQAVTYKFMCWNLLNYPDASNAASDTTLRHPFYRTVVSYEAPDILVTEENTFSSGTTWFLNSVMNVHGNVYSKGTFVNGPDTDNEIYFKTASFRFISNTPIITDLRYISEFKLVHILTSDTIRIYAVHLKASSGSTNEWQRALEVDSLRKVTNQLPPGSNFIVCGDFNIYGDYEASYQKLVQNNVGNDGNFVDPINMAGTWNSYTYRYFHTQSTRTTSFGGGATGGLNDRFDMILFSTAISQGTSNISYISSSTTPIGNDGHHFDDPINMIPNTAAPVDVINALYNASDHLPVTALFTIADPNGIVLQKNEALHFSVYPNPAVDQIRINFTLEKSEKVLIKIFDVAGREVFSNPFSVKPTGVNQVSLFLLLEEGIYLVSLVSESGETGKKLVCIGK